MCNPLERAWKFPFLQMYPTSFSYSSPYMPIPWRTFFLLRFQQTLPSHLPTDFCPLTIFLSSLEPLTADTLFLPASIYSFSLPHLFLFFDPLLLTDVFPRLSLTPSLSLSLFFFHLVLGPIHSTSPASVVILAEIHKKKKTQDAIIGAERLGTICLDRRWFAGWREYTEAQFRPNNWSSISANLSFFYYHSFAQSSLLLPLRIFHPLSR